MTEKNLKIRIGATFAMLLVLAMFIQSIVCLFLDVGSSIREDVEWARRSLETFVAIAAQKGERGDMKQELISISDSLDAESGIFSCINIELADEPISEIIPCGFTDEMLALARQARTKQHTVIGFAGSGWHVFLLRSEAAIFAVPLRDKAGQVVGSVMAERSLQPIYSRYEQETWIVLFYLLVNAIIFSSLGFFRMVRIIFRPLDRLVKKAENYRPDEQSLFLVSDESAFRKLSTSFSTLIGRIERDNRTLRQTVSELEVANRELKEKNDLVVRSEKLAVAGRLSAGLAHEIGNPLSIIQGYVELLGRDDLTVDEKRQFSERAQQELDRIKGLIRQLLDFAGPMHAAEAIVSVNMLIDDVIGFVSLEKTFAGCTITTHLLAEYDEIVADKDALRQVLINCLLNALDATAHRQDREREIAVATSNEENSKNEPILVVSIQDNGSGIGEEHLEYIFDPFFTTKEVGRGTGLGLFVCHTIMEGMGGAITLRNRIPVGVEVRIEIPLRRPKISQPH